MRLIVNGEERIADFANLAEVWAAETAHLGVEGPQGFAVALNGEVVQRAAWGDTLIRDGDRVEIIRAMFGG